MEKRLQKCGELDGFVCGGIEALADDGGGCHGGCGPRTVATRRGGRTVGAERGDGSASTGQDRDRAPASRELDGREVTIASWETAAEEDWLGRWAMNLMLINVSTRRFGCAVRLPEGDVQAPAGSGV